MRYSILFLEYDPNGVNRETTIKSLQSVIDNSKEYDFELIHVKNVKGYVNAVNEGLSRAKGEYIVQVANDVFLEDSKWLEKLTKDNSICGWRTIPFYLTGLYRPDFACWGISREVLNKVGLMDSSYSEGYGFDDDDYFYSCLDKGVGIVDSQIKLTHLETLTYNTVFKEDKEKMMQRNKEIFISKWMDKLNLK